MLGQNLFQNPFQQQYDPYQKQIELQMVQRQLVPQQANTALDELTKVLQTLSPEEQTLLGASEAFESAKLIYEKTFIEFLGTKYRQEFLASQAGSQVAQGLLETTNAVVAEIRERSKNEREKLIKLSKLLEENPNLLEQLEEKKDGRKAK